jgi:hypothetical protein
MYLERSYGSNNHDNIWDKSRRSALDIEKRSPPIVKSKPASVTTKPVFIVVLVGFGPCQLQCELVCQN